MKRTNETTLEQPEKKINFDPASLRAVRRTNTTKPVQQVVICGGTHGNESNGVFLVKHFLKSPALVTRPSFSTQCLFTNPFSIATNTRYVDEDLNRCCFLKDLVSKAKQATKEGGRAIELDAIIGPKSSTDPNADFVFDLHNTTANTGVALMLAPDDEFALSVAAHLLRVDSSVRIVQWADVEDWALVPTLGRSGMTVEVGSCPWGCIEPTYYQQTQKLILAALDYIHTHNTSLSSPAAATASTHTVPVYRRIDTVYYPTDAETKEMTAYIHPDLQNKDFHKLENGAPIFSTFEGQTVSFEGKMADGKAYSTDQLYPFFINEAAYYESKTAFVIGERKEVQAQVWDV